MKIALKTIGGLITFVIALVIIAGVVIMIVVDKQFVEDNMRKALNRHVTIESIDVGIFSVISGIEVNNVAISNYKNERQLELLKDKPVPSKDVFVGLKSFRYKICFLPLLQKQFQLKELVLYEPEIKVVKYKSGAYNYSDLLKPGKTGAKEEKKKVEAKKTAEEPEKPFTVDDIPVAITIGKVGIEKGDLTYLDMNYDQTFQVYNLTVLVSSIDIDAQSLEKHNSMKVDVDFGIKTLGKIKSGSVKSFDLGFSLDAVVKPFDIKTRKLDPELTAKAGMPYGSITGLQIFEKLKSIEALTKYIGRVSFLKDTAKWKNAYVKAWYKAGTVKLEDGNMKTEDYNLAYSGMYNVNSGNINLPLDMILDEKYDQEIRKNLGTNVKKVLKGSLAKIVKPDMVVREAMKPLVNDDGRVFLSYLVTGTLSSPEATLVHPKLPSLEDVAKKTAGSAGDALKEAAEKEVTKAVDTAREKASEEVKKAEDTATKEAKKQAGKTSKSLKKKLKF